MPQISPLVAGDPVELGSFRLSGRIGEGGQGIVYLGVNAKGERGAIKLLHVKFTGDTIARSRFARELKAAQRVASFCTARVIEADLDGDTPYIASEYIDGPALRDIVETEGPLSGTVLDRLAIGTATALTAIHHASIVHRDFKPDNVLIAADGPRVVDFGIARIIDSTGTITSRAIGTPAYMAPEQIAGDDVGPYTDVFSWGATIAFAATGKPAFEGKSIAVVLNRILNHEVDVGMMPEPLRGVVRSALSKSPAARPSADQILLRLLGQPAGAGASTAVLTRGVQVASDDTTPFHRVSAGSITDLPARNESVTGPPEPPRPMTHPTQPPASGSSPQPARSNQPGQAVPPTQPPVTQSPVTQPPVTQSSGAQPPGTQPPQSAQPTRAASGGAPVPRGRSRRGKVWLALGTAIVLLALAAAALVVNRWPLAFGEEPTPTEEPTRTFATVVDKVAQTGKVVIGVKGDLPGVGLQDGDDFQGVDIEIARRIATELGARETELVRVSRDDRASSLADGSVDLIVATYSVDKSDTQFAGPYYLAHQDVLVRAGSGIETVDDLAGKALCAPNSPSVGEVQDRVKVRAVPASDYAICMDLLKSGKVDAVPGDDLILAGFAARENMRFKILGAKFNNERYAVGIRQGDVKTCKAVKAVIADLYRTGYMKQLLTRAFGKVDFELELKVPAMETC
ncbi:transporter substrate-binding domain-containing protein [Nonomuraea phyllanthi]|uniref:serine/threonine-protein kinase n=1 Tax=Nonomuraea phyllanthi TaxID=2219224 RepID=UPI0012930683|nr:serine/threonine-protein kinase [Nonomuraea phyllanthi]QFY06229.1 transporter substrate-binding domain-containing protein [Nonomuraea phyllanthi]